MRYLKITMRTMLGMLFVAAGVNHFVNTAFYVSIMPPYLPRHRESVYVIGIAEAVLGFLLFIPRTSRPADWGLITLLIAVFPANIHMAMHPELFPKFSATALYVRLPIQGLLIAWAYWHTRPATSSTTVAP